MNVTLTPEQESLVRQKVSSGRYRDTSEVIALALRLLDQQDRTWELGAESLREEIEVGLEQARGGQLVPGEQVFEEIRRMSRNRRAQSGE
jgi:antitoxin ParD1/3/4